MTKVSVDRLLELSKYNKELRKCGLSVSDLIDLNDNYEITATVEKFKKDGKKVFPKEPTSSETNVISALNLGYYATSTGFFKDRITKGYTPIGNVVTQLVAFSPDRQSKTVIKFSYKRK